MLHEKRLENNIYLSPPVKRESVLAATACRGRSSSINMPCRSFTVSVAPPPSATSSQIDVCLMQEEGNADVFVSLTGTVHKILSNSSERSNLGGPSDPITGDRRQVCFCRGIFIPFIEIILPPTSINVSITVSVERREVAGTKEQRSDFWVHYLIKSFRTLF